MIAVIVTNHLDQNIPYLKRCLLGLSKQVFKGDLFAVCISAAETEPPKSIHGITVIHKPELRTSYAKIGYAMERLPKEVTHVMFLSDDVILNKDCIDRMYETSKALGDRAIVIPASNSDCTSQFIRRYEVGGKVLLPNMDITDTANLEEAIINYDPTIDLIQNVQQWASFFAPLIPLELYNKVGGLDEKLDTSHNDVEFCFRARELGYHVVLTHWAFAFHYGSRTLKYTTNEKEKLEAAKHFLQKRTQSA